MLGLAEQIERGIKLGVVSLSAITLDFNAPGIMSMPPVQKTRRLAAATKTHCRPCDLITAQSFSPRRPSAPQSPARRRCGKSSVTNLTICAASSTNGLSHAVKGVWHGDNKPLNPRHGRRESAFSRPRMD